MDMTKRLRLVKSSTMVDVKVVLISKNTIFIKHLPIRKLQQLHVNVWVWEQLPERRQLTGNVSSPKVRGTLQEMILQTHITEHLGPARTEFQSGTLTTLKNVACLSTTEAVKVRWKHFSQEHLHQMMITGNGNKYDSEEECQKACPKEFLQADICQLPKETGPCFDLVERYYFDFQMGTCQRFEFGGCEGIILLLPIHSSLILNSD